MPITITRDLEGPMRHTVRVGRHEFVVDEPPAAGGEDAGPTPHDIYDAAIGACKALTLVWYAQRKGLPLEDVEVTVERDDSREKEGVYRLTTRIALGGDLSAEVRERLLSIAARCPVHKLMTEVKTEIETVWK